MKKINRMLLGSIYILLFLLNVNARAYTNSNCYLLPESEVVQHFSSTDDALININIQDATAPFDLTLVNPSGERFPAVIGENIIASSGIYRIEIIDANGCIGHAMVSVLNLDQGRLCLKKGDCMSLSDFGDEGENCFSWFYADDPDNNKIDNDTEVCPEETTDLIRVVTNDDGWIVSREEFTILVFEHDLFIKSIPDVVCNSEDTYLYVDYSPGYYQWNTGPKNSGTPAEIPGDYVVQYANHSGCLSSNSYSPSESSGENIHELLTGNGFKCLPIELDPLSGNAADCNPACFDGSPTCTKAYSDKTFELTQIDNEISNLTKNLNDNLERLRISKGLSAAKAFVTDNATFCECPGSFTAIQSEFESAELAVWAHVWEDDNGGPPEVCYKLKNIDENETSFIDLLLDPELWNEEAPGCTDMDNARAVIDLSQIPISQFAFNDSHKSQVNNGGLYNYGGVIPEGQKLFTDAVANAVARYSGFRVGFITSAAGVGFPTNSDPPTVSSITLAKEKYDEVNDFDMLIWVHFTPGGVGTFCVKIGTQYLDGFPFNPLGEGGPFPADIRTELTALTIDNIETMAAQPLVNLEDPNPYVGQYDDVELEGLGISTQAEERPWHFGFREGDEWDKEKNFAGITKAVGGMFFEMVKTGNIPELVWQKDQECLFDFPGGIVGPLNACIENNPFVGIFQIGVLIKDLATQKELRDAMLQALMDPVTMAKGIIQSKKDIYNGSQGKEVFYYHAGYDGVSAIIFFLGGGPAQIMDIISSFGKTAKGAALGIKDKLAAFPKNIKSAFYRKYKKHLPNDINDEAGQAFLDFLNRIDVPHWEKIIKNPDLIGIWKQTYPTGAIPTNVFKKFPELPNQEFYDQLKKVFINADGDVLDKAKGFLEDLDESLVLNTDLFDGMIDAPGKITAWSSISPSKILRSQDENLEAILREINNHEAKLDDFTNKFENASDLKRNDLVNRVEAFFGFKTNRFEEEILSIPKPDRPTDVSDYLIPSYIARHKTKFNEEGGSFIAVKSWIEQGNPNHTTLPKRKFVGLKSEMDEIIDEYKASGNDWTILRDKLNLGAGTNLEGAEIFYVRIDVNDSRFSYEIPNGNEGGANPDWTPGGFTKSGTAEAALVGAKEIVHNRDINVLLSKFNDWEQIQ